MDRELHSSFLHGEAVSGSVCDNWSKKETDSSLLYEADLVFLTSCGVDTFPHCLQFCPFCCWFSVVGAASHPLWLLLR